MRLHVLFLGSLAICALPLVAHADTVYNFTLTSIRGYSGGSGSFALNIPPPSTEIVTYASSGGGGYGSKGYLIDSFVENYTPPPGGPNPTALSYPPYEQTIQFRYGVVSNIDGFIYDIGPNNCQAQLQIDAANYFYTFFCFTDPLNPVVYLDDGIVTITPATTTPEPSGLVLVGTAMLGILGLVRQRSQE